MVSTVMDLKKIPLNELQELIKDTYNVFQFYCKESLVPKEISKLLLEMGDFLYFASIMEGIETERNFYFYQIIHVVIKSLEKGFLKGKYECDYPVLMVYDSMQNQHILDLEHGRLEELM